MSDELKTDTKYLSKTLREMANWAAASDEAVELLPIAASTIEKLETERDALREQVATLTKERDEARERLRIERGEFSETVAKLQASNREMSEGTRLIIDAAKSELATLQQTRVIEERETKAALFAAEQREIAAKADAARLREALKEASFDVEALFAFPPGEPRDQYRTHALAGLKKAFDEGATDSAAWLESKIAERTALHVEREKSLEASLVAATNDAARAELRARNVATVVASVSYHAGGIRALGHGDGDDVKGRDELLSSIVSEALAASSDSDERLRKLVEFAVRESQSAEGIGSEKELQGTVRDILNRWGTA